MNPLSEIIRREAAQRGVLSFARFMELALYCPVHGYYETKKDNPGRHGDFYTSVGVGELFGQLLAFQFAEWLEDIAKSCEIRGSTVNLLRPARMTAGWPGTFWPGCNPTARNCSTRSNTGSSSLRPAGRNGRVKLCVSSPRVSAGLTVFGP